MSGRMSAIVEITPQLMAITTLQVKTPGSGFSDLTANARAFIDKIGAADGVLFIYLRHTSASLTIQENADPDVQTDLAAALDTSSASFSLENLQPAITTPSEFLSAAILNDEIALNKTDHSPPLLLKHDVYLQNCVFRI